MELNSIIEMASNTQTLQSVLYFKFSLVHLLTLKCSTSTDNYIIHSLFNTIQNIFFVYKI